MPTSQTAMAKGIALRDEVAAADMEEAKMTSMMPASSK
jgi:hypothetical protein